MTATLNTKKDRPHYYVVIRYLDEKTGTKRQKWETTDIPVKGNNKRRAERRKDEILEQYKNKHLDLSNSTLFTDFMRQWLINRKHAIEQTTYEGYLSIFEKHVCPFFEPKKLKVRDVTPSHIQQYITHTIEKVSANSIKRHLANISTCMDAAIRHNIISFNPVKRVELPKVQAYNRPTPYNERQIAKLLEISANDPLEIIIFLAIFYGLRKGEIIGLKWQAVDFENMTISICHTVTQGRNAEIRKNSAKTTSSNVPMPLTKMIAKRLQEWKQEQAQHKNLQPNDYIDEGYIFTKLDGSLIKPHYVSQHFKLLLKKHNMPHIRFHDLRHSSAEYVKSIGFDIKDVQGWLRHADLATTSRFYLKSDMLAKRNIAENLDQHFAHFTS